MMASQFGATAMLSAVCYRSGAVEKALDTNVVVDATTIRALNVAAEATPLVRRSVVEMRRRRAREALALTWLFHKLGMTTFSLRHEVEQLLKRVAPATSLEGMQPWFFT
jgi:hypothetical protein